MIELNAERVRNNVRKAATEDLLDRATVYRGEMEAAALKIIDAELAERGVTVEEVQTHLEARRGVLSRSDGTVVKCHFCHRPAVAQQWSWHRFFGKIPLFPRRVARCVEHLPKHEEKAAAPTDFGTP